MHSTRGWPRVQPCHEVHHALFAHLSEAKRLEPFHRHGSAEIISPVYIPLETAVPVCMGGEKERSMHISTARVPEGEITGQDSHGFFDRLPRWPSSFSQSLARYILHLRYRERSPLLSVISAPPNLLILRFNLTHMSVSSGSTRFVDQNVGSITDPHNLRLPHRTARYVVL